ncbi:MAG: extracellular solute-binding protein, partial [Anaerolineales bacterium]
MKAIRKTIYFLLAGTLLLMSLTACQPAETPEPEGPVTITYWHTMSDPETAQLENVIAAFEAANPNITVDATRYAYDDFKPALLTALAGEEGPDTARLDIAWVSEFADQEALMQLDGVMPGFEGIIAGTFPGPLSTNYWEGHYYGLPQNTNTQVLLWNKEVFEAGGATPPETMEEFAQVACDLTEGEEQYGYALGGTYFWAPAPIFYAMGGQIVDDDISTADGYINGPESVAAFTMLKDLFDQGCISPNVLGGGIGTADGHATGLYAMIIDGPWMVDIYKGNYPDFEVNFAPIPTGPDGTTSSVVGGEDLVIFEGTEHADAAMKWAAFLLGEESQKMMAEVGVIPTLSSLAGDESLPEYFDVFMEQLETAQARVPHPKWGDMDGAINNAFQRMLRGEQSVQAALDQAAGEINELLGAEPVEVSVEPVSITYWHTMSDPETAQLENVIAAFEAANPNITVDATRYAYDDFKPALLTALAG